MNGDFKIAVAALVDRLDALAATPQLPSERRADLAAARVELKTAQGKSAVKDVVMRISGVASFLDDVGRPVVDAARKIMDFL